MMIFDTVQNKSYTFQYAEKILAVEEVIVPKVSVIIPVYNTAPWLEECLNSVINQTLADLEIICVDDASTDKSGRILKQYAQKDKRIQIITLKENLGQSHARNIGLDRAGGEYIYFLDSDDYIIPDALDIMYKESTSKALEILYIDANPVFENENFRNRYATYLFSRNASNYAGEVYKGLDLLNRFLKNEEWTCSMPRHFFLAEFLKSYHFHFQEGRIHEDELFAFQCALAAERAGYSSQKLFCRRFREDSTMTKKESADNFIGYFSAVWYMNKIAHEEKCYNKEIRSYIAKMSNRCINLYVKYKEEIYKKIFEFNDEELKNAFIFFESQQDTYCAYGDLSDALIDKIREHDNIYIYGAGVIARSVFAGLVRKDIPISGFIVSKVENNPQTLEGHRVIDILKFSEIADKKNCIVVIALKAGLPEVKKKLSLLGIANLDYRYEGAH